MFGLIDKKKQRMNRCPGEVFATQDGKAVPLAEMPDDMIRNEVLGKGIAIIPRNGRVVSPVDGTVTAIANSRHAFCIETTDGLEVMVHIGVDTVKLGGRGFTAYVKKGDYVLAGALLCEVDLAFLEDNKTPCHTAILIANHEEIGGIVPAWGEVSAGVSTIIQYHRPGR